MLEITHALMTLHHLVKQVFCEYNKVEYGNPEQGPTIQKPMPLVHPERMQIRTYQ